MKTMESTMESLAGWLMYRVKNASSSTIPIRVGQFEGMWLDEFGTLDNIPKELKEVVNNRYEHLRANLKD